nr:hypothetical protein CFP56_07312 [Quercus suber]
MGWWFGLAISSLSSKRSGVQASGLTWLWVASGGFQFVVGFFGFEFSVVVGSDGGGFALRVVMGTDMWGGCGFYYGGSFATVASSAVVHAASSLNRFKSALVLKALSMVESKQTLSSSRAQSSLSGVVSGVRLVEGEMVDLEYSASRFIMDLEISALSLLKASKFDGLPSPTGMRRGVIDGCFPLLGVASVSEGICCKSSGI